MMAEKAAGLIGIKVPPTLLLPFASWLKWVVVCMVEYILLNNKILWWLSG